MPRTHIGEYGRARMQRQSIATANTKYTQFNFRLFMHGVNSSDAIALPGPRFQLVFDPRKNLDQFIDTISGLKLDMHRVVASVCTSAIQLNDQT